MDVQELQNPEKLWTILVKNLNKIMNKINNTVSSMIGMKITDVIKLDIVPQDQIYPEETVLAEDGLYRYLYQPGEQHEDKKKKRVADLIWCKSFNWLDQVAQEPGNRVLYFLQDRPDRTIVREELMHIPEDI